MTGKLKTIVAGVIPAVMATSPAALRADEVQSVAAQVLAQLAEHPPAPVVPMPVPAPAQIMMQVAGARF